MRRIFLIAAIAATPFPPPARAQARDNVQLVRTADLDLSQARDVRRLDRRIARAAAAACGPTSDVDPAGRNAVLRCRFEAAERVAAARAEAITARAQRQVGPPLASR